MLTATAFPLLLVQGQSVSGSPTGSSLGRCPPPLEVFPTLTLVFQSHSLYKCSCTPDYDTIYVFPASILHPLVMCWILSGVSLHNQHLGSCMVWYIWAIWVHSLSMSSVEALSLMKPCTYES